MVDIEKNEKRVLKISFWAGVLFVIAELFMAIYSKSQAILMDMAIDSTELIVIAASLLLAPLLYKPISERHPFGFSQCETLFIIVKGFMLLAVIFSLIASNIQMILNGGNHVNAGLVAFLEFILTGFSLIVLLLMMYFSKKISTPILDIEIFGWKVDFVCGLGLGLAFLIPNFLRGTSLENFIPYLDQVVSIILALVVLPRPVQMIIQSVKSILLFAPKTEITEAIRQRVTAAFLPYGFEIDFADITLTGRKLWVAITFTSKEESISTKQVKVLYDALLAELIEEFEEIDLELIPAWDQK